MAKGKIEFEEPAENWACHGCGKCAKVTPINFPYLQQRTLDLCDKCLEKLRKILEKEAPR